MVLGEGESMKIVDTHKDLDRVYGLLCDCGHTFTVSLRGEYAHFNPTTGITRCPVCGRQESMEDILMEYADKQEERK